ncbi:hypothetical protein DF186_20490, partial [Enterococcus hirae]
FGANAEYSADPRYTTNGQSPGEAPSPAAPSYQPLEQYAGNPPAPVTGSIQNPGTAEASPSAQPAFAQGTYPAAGDYSAQLDSN